jgi:hypothetical protein
MEKNLKERKKEHYYENIARSFLRGKCHSEENLR